jgi:hypothetical protein
MIEDSASESSTTVVAGGAVALGCATAATSRPRQNRAGPGQLVRGGRPELVVERGDQLGELSSFELVRQRSIDELTETTGTDAGLDGSEQLGVDGGGEPLAIHSVTKIPLGSTPAAFFASHAALGAVGDAKNGSVRE